MRALGVVVMAPLVMVGLGAVAVAVCMYGLYLWLAEDMGE